MRLRRPWECAARIRRHGQVFRRLRSRWICSASTSRNSGGYGTLPSSRQSPAGSALRFEPARGDKRFKDDAWQETPYYDLLKQSYLLASTQLHELVDHAQVDDRTRLQLRFHARQFIDAMSPSNFPATNPEVIRKAIETRSASLSAGIQNLIEDIQKGRITRVDEFAFEVGATSRSRRAGASLRTN